MGPVQRIVDTDWHLEDGQERISVIHWIPIRIYSIHIIHWRQNIHVARKPLESLCLSVKPIQIAIDSP